MLCVTLLLSKTVENSYQPVVMSTIFNKILRRKSSRIVSSQRDSSAGLDAVSPSKEPTPSSEQRSSRASKRGNEDVPYRPVLPKDHNSSPVSSDSDRELLQVSPERSASESTAEENLLNEFENRQSYRLSAKLHKLELVLYCGFYSSETFTKQSMVVFETTHTLYPTTMFKEKTCLYLPRCVCYVLGKGCK